MLNDITLGQYFPGNSVIHRMDPRMKLILTILYIVGVFIVANLPGYAIALAFLYIVVRISGIKFSYLAKGVKPLRFIIIFTFILNLFFVQGETPIFTLGFFTLTKEALNNAIYFALRLVFLVMGTSVLTLTTSPVQLTDGLERIMHPLEKIHFPAHELAMMMTIALRFIPTLLEETDKIQKAQMARGADFESGSLQYAVMGLGVNISRPKGGFPSEISDIASSLYSEEAAGNELKCALAAEILNNFFDICERMSVDKLTEEYKSYSVVLGKRIRVISSNTEYYATAVDIDKNARLIVRDENGDMHTLSSAEVSVREGQI